MASISCPGNQATQILRWESDRSLVRTQIKEDGSHIWPFDPAFPIDCRSLTFETDPDRPLTRHDYFELLYVYSGKALYQFEGRQVVAEENDLIVINGSIYHRLSEVLVRPFKAVVFYFLPDILRGTEATGEDVQYLMPFLLQDSDFPHVISRRTGVPVQVFELIKKIQAQLPAITDYSRLAARTYLTMILVLLINHYESHLALAGAFDRRRRAFDRLRPLFDYLEVHYAESISLSKATDIVGMSKAHLMRLFKQVTGHSFDTYLNHFRIAKAQVLLASTDKPISEVSRDVGFCDQSYFGLVFRKLIQVTPREYRKILQDA
jgi:AraC-like DNA-binding protein/mannose-6-phosphate isomerase-like protein (cupin superfamily)